MAGHKPASIDELRPQDWIVTALEGFFADEGRGVTGEAKGAPVAKLALACAGIQGEVEIEPFERLVSRGRRVIYTAEQKRKAVDRELSYRRRVYPRWIEQNRMTKRQADEQIAIFEAIRDDYAKAETSERLI